MAPGIAPGMTTAAALGLCAMAGWRLRGHRRLASPLWLPLLAIAGLCVLGTWFSLSPQASWPKLWGVVLGVFVFRVVVAACTTRARLQAGIATFLVVGALAVGAGLLATSLNNKYLPRQVTELVPHRLVPVDNAEGAVNPNALGATTLYFLPLVLALLVQPRPSRGEAAAGPPRTTSPTPSLRLILTVYSLFMASVLALSQSRASAAGFVVTLALMVAVAGPGLRVRAAVCATLVLAGALLFASFEPTFRASPEGSVLDAAGRTALWVSGLRAAGDFAFTGVGLNAFREIVHSLYPPAGISPSIDVAHAHNVFLQVTLDLGVGGLVCYLALLAVAGTACMRCRREGDARTRALALGLAGGITATHVFGLADAIALGAKVGVFFWWTLGLIAALHRLSPGERGPLEPPLGRPEEVGPRVPTQFTPPSQS